MSVRQQMMISSLSNKVFTHSTLTFQGFMEKLTYRCDKSLFKMIF